MTGRSSPPLCACQTPSPVCGRSSSPHPCSGWLLRTLPVGKQWERSIKILIPPFPHIRYCFPLCHQMVFKTGEIFILIQWWAHRFVTKRLCHEQAKHSYFNDGKKTQFKKIDNRHCLLTVRLLKIKGRQFWKVGIMDLTCCSWKLPISLKVRSGSLLNLRNGQFVINPTANSLVYGSTHTGVHTVQGCSFLPVIQEGCSFIEDHMTFQSYAGRNLKAFRGKRHKGAEIKMPSSQGEGDAEQT